MSSTCGNKCQEHMQNQIKEREREKKEDQNRSDENKKLYGREIKYMFHYLHLIDVSKDAIAHLVVVCLVTF